MMLKSFINLQQNWDDVQQALQFVDEDASTDVLYAVAAQLFGREQCTVPSLDFINFVHMKPAINGIADTEKFTDVYTTEFDQGMIRINNVNQYHPLHYYEKDFVTKEMIEYYGSRIFKGS